jgi:hypothetical protein
LGATGAIKNIVTGMILQVRDTNSGSSGYQLNEMFYFRNENENERSMRTVVLSFSIGYFLA